MDWFSKNKIELLYIADSNFGWVEQDNIVAQGLVERAAKYGYPKKVVLTWAKNPNDNCNVIHSNLIKKDTYSVWKNVAKF